MQAPEVVLQPPEKSSSSLSTTSLRARRFLDALSGSVQDILIAAANKDERIRVATPYGSEGDADAQLSEKERLEKFVTRIREEQRITDHNNGHAAWKADTTAQPEEYFDYCLVFRTHPADFVAEEAKLPTATPRSVARHERHSGTKRAKQEEELSQLRLSKDQMRNYLANVCCYRDIDTLENKFIDKSNHYSYFSSFSLETHHVVHPPATWRVEAIDKIVNAFKKAARATQKPTEHAEIELSNQTPLLCSSSEDTQLLSPPLALITNQENQTAYFKSAGADNLPPFYGLSDFMTALDDSPEDFEMSALDFFFVVREMFTSALRKCGADLMEIVSHDGCKLIVKARLSERAARKVANHLEYICQADIGAYGNARGRLEDNFPAPYIPFDSCAEDRGTGFFAARKGRAIWARYDGLSRPVSLNAVEEEEREPAEGKDLARMKNLVEEKSPSPSGLKGPVKMLNLNLHQMKEEGKLDGEGGSKGDEEKDSRMGKDSKMNRLKLRTSLFKDIDRIRLLIYVMEFHFDFTKLSQPFHLTTINKLDPHTNKTVLFRSHAKKSYLPPVILSSFALHKRHTQAHLGEVWADFAKVYTTSQPLNLIRDYFGEQIAFYFLWTGFITDALKWPSYIGLAVFLVQLFGAKSGRYENIL